MIKSILRSIAIFWMHIYKLHKGIIKRINSIIMIFLWARIGIDRKIHLVCRGEATKLRKVVGDSKILNVSI